MDNFPVTLAAAGHLAAVVPLVFSGEAQFFDISDPANPQLVSEQEFAAGSIPPGIALADSKFSVVSEGRVNIIDASSPNAPAETVEFPNPDWDGPPTNGGGITGIGLDSVAPSDTFQGVAASGEYLYVAASDNGLLVVDVSDAANLEQVGQIELPGRAVKAVAEDGLVHVLGVDVEEGAERPVLVYTVHIVDLSNPEDPQLVDSIEGFESQGPLSSLIAGNDAFYLADLGTLHVIERPQ